MVEHERSHPHQHTPAPHEPGENEDAEQRLDPREFWEQRYSGETRVWSGKVNRTLAEVVGDSEPGRSLDLGCGEGGDVLWLAERGWHATGIDLSETAVGRAQAEAAARGLQHARFVAADLEEWVSQGSDVDGVTEPLDLISASFLQSPVELARERILRAARDRLAPGGILVLVSHAAPPPWAQNHGRGPRQFPTPESELTALGLSPGAGGSSSNESARFAVLHAEIRTREAVGPDGSTVTLDDTLVVVQRNR